MHAEALRKHLQSIILKDIVFNKLTFRRQIYWYDLSCKVVSLSIANEQIIGQCVAYWSCFAMFSKEYWNRSVQENNFNYSLERKISNTLFFKRTTNKIFLRWHFIEYCFDIHIYIYVRFNGLKFKTNDSIVSICEIKIDFVLSKSVLCRYFRL